MCLKDLHSKTGENVPEKSVRQVTSDRNLGSNLAAEWLEIWSAVAITRLPRSSTASALKSLG
jgi:hypothetical protein